MFVRRNYGSLIRNTPSTGGYFSANRECGRDALGWPAKADATSGEAAKWRAGHYKDLSGIPRIMS